MFQSATAAVLNVSMYTYTVIVAIDFASEMEHCIAALLQPDWGAQEWTHWRGPAWTAQQPDAVRGTGGRWQKGRTQRLWQRLRHTRWHWLVLLSACCSDSASDR